MEAEDNSPQTQEVGNTLMVLQVVMVEVDGITVDPVGLPVTVVRVTLVMVPPEVLDIMETVELALGEVVAILT